MNCQEKVIVGGKIKMRKSEKVKGVGFLSFLCPIFYSSFFARFMLLFFVLSFLLLLLPSEVYAGYGEENVTTLTNFSVGASEPIIDSVTIEPETISLSPNSSVLVDCVAYVTNDAGAESVNLARGEMYSVSSSFVGDDDDNNYHYTNESCLINRSYGDGYEAKVNCSFELEYYTFSGDWNCSVNVTNDHFSALSENESSVEPLLALGLPDVIDYGVVDAFNVSSEKIANVTNLGNVQVNLSLSGYAQSEGDGLSMNCSLGGVSEIPIEYEKYNLSGPNEGVLSLSEFDSKYFNLSSSPVTREFGLSARENDSFNEALNESYWRIYVPEGVGGTCQGNVVVGAVQAPEA